MSLSAKNPTSRLAFNATDCDFTVESTTLAMFERQVRERPEALAAVSVHGPITYAQLDAQAAGIARRLASAGVLPGVLVVLLAARGVPALAGLIGVHKAGAAYVPVDLQSPDQRITFLIEDTRAACVLTDAPNANRARELCVKAGLPPEAALGLEDIDPEPGNASAVLAPGALDLAYVIYTSGTTGQPKGVMIEHRSVVNYALNVAARTGLGPGSVCDFSTNLAFDLTVTHTLVCLALGGCVAVFEGDVHDMDAYVAHLVKHGVTAVKLTPAYFAQLAGRLQETSVVTAILGGEKLSATVLRKIRTRSDQALAVYDEYGPTEATVGACFSQVFPRSPDVPLHIGQPYDNLKAYVLDDKGAQVVVGEVGELCLGGSGLARGYWNRPALTDERFLPNPFQTADEAADTRFGPRGRNARIYRTGDLVRWRADGNLEYVGRNDHQVKVRGHRIELSEIEDTLEMHGDVERAVVLPWRDTLDGPVLGLTAYVVAGEFGCSAEELGAHVGELLPAYMAPSRYIFLDSFPLSPNGKIDRRVLPSPAPRERAGRVLPRTQSEHVVRAIWAELLDLNEDEIGMTDEFFQLGGDSIVAIQLLSRLRRELGVQIPVAQVLQRNTIERFCEYLVSEASRAAALQVVVERGVPEGVFPLLPIQRWFFDSALTRPHHFNQAFLIDVPPLDVVRLEEAVRRLAEYHLAFRLRFPERPAGAEVQQYVRDTSEVTLSRSVVANVEDMHRLLTDWQSEFDLGNGPLFRFGYVDRLPGERARVFIACHHLIVDAVSWRILATDLRSLYEGRALPPAGSSYRQWIEAVGRYAATHADEVPYWQARLDAFRREGDGALRSLVVSEGARATSCFRLREAETHDLLRHVHRAFRTQINDVLLAAFAAAMKDLTGQGTTHVVLEGHGREDIDPAVDVGRTVGWFTTMFPVCLEAGEDALDGLRRVKETLRAVPAKGLGFGALFGYDRTQLPRINFNYLGQFDRDETASGATEWRLAPEPAGNQVHSSNRDENLITLNGWVSDGRLTVSIATKLGQVGSDLLARHFQLRLLALIETLAGLERSYLTPSDVDQLLSMERLDALQRHVEIEAVLPANSLQQGFIHHALTRPDGDDAYTVQALWRYTKPIDPEILRKAWCHAQQRHPALRMRFSWDEELVQVVDARASLDWTLHDLGNTTPGQRDAAIEALRQADRAQPYDLLKGPLFRLRLVVCGPSDVVCLFSHHHAILDGWSITVLLDHVHEAYRQLQAGQVPDAASDRAYIAAQRELRLRAYDQLPQWQRRLQTNDERLDLTGLLSRSARARGARVPEQRSTAAPRERSFAVSGPTLSAVRELARSKGVTVNAVFLYVWHRLLSCYTGSRRTISGIVVSGRGLAIDDIESAVGLLINTLPMVVDHGDADQTVGAGLADIQQLVNAINAQSAVHLASLSCGQERLFDTLFIYENWPRIDEAGWRERYGVRLEGEYEKLDYPLAAIVSETFSHVRVRLVYAGELFDDALMGGLAQTFEHLLDEVTARRDEPASRLQYLNDARRAALNEALAGPELKRLEEGLSFISRFDAQAARAPNQVALRAGPHSMTYRQLAARSVGLARRLLDEFDLAPEDRVAVAIDKDASLIVALLGAMRAGGAYVPVDISAPDARIAGLLSDAAPRVTLVASAHLARIAPLAAAAGSATVAVDLDANEEVAMAGSGRTLPEPRGERLMYVMYTSGTTGRPKGVMVEHQAYCRLLDAVLEQHFSSASSLTTCSLTKPVFDIFGLEYGLPLMTGGTVELIDDLPDRLDCSGLDFLQMTPSVADLMVERLVGGANTLLLIGGERLDSALLRRALRSAAGVVNVYGPTETTIWSTSRHYSCNEGPVPHVTSLGLPFRGEKLRIVDRWMRMLPPGAPGELCIGGAGLARGYLGQDALTTERFVVTERGERIYRTGDLVRLDGAGEIEYLGRNDLQVKIRGHRVELGEIECAIAALPGVSQCAVLALDRGGPLLAAYCVAAPEVDLEALHEPLSRVLPSHLIPEVFIRLNRLPLNANGKLDRAALPAPSFVKPASVVHAAVRSRVDTSIRDCFASLLAATPDSVGIDDDFYRLGGNSILSIKLAASLRRELDVEVSARDVLTHRTVRQLADLAARRRKSAAAGALPAGIPVLTYRAEAALSFAQERLWFIDRLEEGASAYHVPLLIEVAASVDEARLADALRDLVSRHEVLRTVIRERSDGTPYQHVLDMAELRQELRRENAAGPAATLASMRKWIAMPFDLAVDGPLRAVLFKDPVAGLRRLLLVAHHVAVDGWSMDIVLRDLERFYADRVVGEQSSAEPVRPAYIDYAAWERQALDGSRMAALRAFWKAYLDRVEPLVLPLDHLRPPTPDYLGAHVGLILSAAASGHLRALAQELKVGLFSVLLGAYTVALHAFTGQRDIVVGTPVVHRDRPELAELVGCFINTLPVRARIDRDLLLKEHLLATSSGVLQVLNHQDMPFDRLVEALTLPRDSSRHPVYQVAFGLNGARATLSPEPHRSRGWLRLDSESATLHAAARFDLSTHVDDGKDQLELNVLYATSMFRHETVERFARLYRQVLERTAMLSGRPDLQVLMRVADVTGPDADQSQVVAQGTAAHVLTRGEQRLHVLFKHQAARTPDALALSSATLRLTFRALDAAADRLAAQLRPRLRAPEPLVAICVDRSAEAIVAILAVLKAGGAYVPIDAANPDERIAFILHDCGSPLLLARGLHRPRCERLIRTAGLTDVSFVELAFGPENPGADAPTFSQSPLSGPPGWDAGPTDGSALAYAIYTSGSTGQPKGVLVEHRSVVHLWHGLRDTVFRDCEPSSVIGLNASMAFDSSVKMIVQLLSGHTLVPVPEEARLDVTRLTDFARTQGLNVLDFTPSQLDGLIAGGLLVGGLAAVRHVLVGGEAVSRELWRQLGGHADIQFHNLYGPTECTVDATTCRIGKGADVPNIGRPLPGVPVYVLAEDGRQVPPGAEGEIYIGGVQVARGYLHRPGLNAERFVADPFDSAPGARMYRTGDLGRWRHDGTIEFLGRNDGQIKLRGHRVELGEVESVLKRITGVDQCAVVLRAGHRAGEERLVAYCVAPSPIDATAVLARLRTELPTHMVPVALARLDRFPLTVNGKLDKGSLPEIEMPVDIDVVAPADDTDLTVLAVVGETLGVPPDKISMHDNFFPLGGNSIQSIRLAAALGRRLSLDVRVATVFQHGNLADLARALRASDVRRTAIPAAPPGGARPLSFAQERFWFIDRYEGGTAAYNVFVCFDVSPEADLDLIARSLIEVCRRHEVLRSRIALDANGHPFSQIDDSPAGLPKIDLVRVDGLASLRDHALALAHRRFDLVTETPCRATLFVDGDVPERRAVLAVLVHHLAFDGWSTGLLRSELLAFYDALARGASPSLAPLPVQYGDYAAWERASMTGPRVARLVEHWRRRLVDAPALKLPIDHPRPARVDYRGASLPFSVDAEVSDALRRMTVDAGATLHSVLLSAYALLLCDAGGQHDVVVGVPMLDRHHEQTQELIGCFVNPTALRLQLDAGERVADWIRRVSERLVDAQRHRDLPFERLVQELATARDPSRHPLFQVWFDMRSTQVDVNGAASAPVLALTAIEGIGTDDASNRVTRFDLSLEIDERGESLRGAFTYATSLFEPNTIDGFVDRYRIILSAYADVSTDADFAPASVLDVLARLPMLRPASVPPAPEQSGARSRPRARRPSHPATS